MDGDNDDGNGDSGVGHKDKGGSGHDSSNNNGDSVCVLTWSPGEGGRLLNVWTMIPPTHAPPPP